MEVHHPHHLGHKKKWKEYFLEFLMLFVAVTLGFFAENIREHYVEKSREEKFIAIVHEDLLNDIRALNKLKHAYEQRLKREDTLLNLLALQNFTKTNDLYYLARLNSVREFFHHSKNGFLQLKNAGGLRMVENISIIKKIQGYEISVDEMDELQSLTENLLMNYREKMAEIFDGRIFRVMATNPSAESLEDRFSRPLGNPALISSNSAEINQFLNKALYVHNNNIGILNRLNKLLKEANDLNAVLINHYKIGI
ncbi:MAG: hypothetical protein EBX50_06240 [Chitinophagia bacterium]|nr:hypothetical protein [Chitinophagia bacterium]